MNATKWLSLTGFVKYLGREGICTVDETEKGWFVTWIDRLVKLLQLRSFCTCNLPKWIYFRDPETLARQAAAAKKRKMDKDDDERLLEFIEKQVKPLLFHLPTMYREHCSSILFIFRWNEQNRTKTGGNLLETGNTLSSSVQTKMKR